MKLAAACRRAGYLGAVIAIGFVLSLSTPAMAEEAHAKPAAAAESHAAAAHGTEVKATAETEATTGSTSHAAAAHEAHGKAAGHGEEAHEEHPELPSFISVILAIPVGDTTLAHSPVGHFLHNFHKQILLIVIVSLSALFFVRTAGLRAVMPTRLQVVMEAYVEFVENLVISILGEQGRQHIPYFGTLFTFILINNLCGIVPFLGAPTSAIQTTVTIAVVTYGYVLYHNFKMNGLKGYLLHAIGYPNAPLWLAPIFFIIHCIEEVARPLSLALRLFGNILGKDILIGVFMMLGISFTGFLLFKAGILSDPANTPIGIPFQFPFYFLAVLLSAVQALVFTLLSIIYLLLALPHDHDHEHDEHGHEAHGTVEAHAAH